MQTVKERLKHFLATLPNSKGKIGLSEGEFEKITGLSNSAVSNIGESFSTNTLLKILDKYPKLNFMWLLTGAKPMLLDTENTTAFHLSKNPVIEPAIFVDLLAVLAEIGSTRQKWGSKEEGIAELYNRFSVPDKLKKVTGTHGGEGKNRK